MKHSVHDTKEAAKREADKLRKVWRSVIFSRQPEGWVVYRSTKRR